MAITQSIIKQTVHGDERVIHGSFVTTGGVTTAVLNHGMNSKLRNISITLSGTVTNWKLDSSLATGITSSTVAVTFGTANMAGTFIAYGD